MVAFSFGGFINAVSYFTCNYYFEAFKDDVIDRIKLPKRDSEILTLVSLRQLGYKNIKAGGRKNIGYEDWIDKSCLDEILIELEGHGLLEKQESGEYLHTEKAQNLKYKYHYLPLSK